jgi:uridine kinase
MTQLSPPERFVGITGGSCSGKTTLEDGLRTRFGDHLAIFPFDDMFIGRSALAGQVVTDWESPDLYRWDDFTAHMRDLKAGRAVTIIAKSRESKAAGITTRVIEPRPIIVVAGFLTLHHSEVRELFDTTIYLDLAEEEIIRRRLARATPGSPWDSEEYIHNALIPGHRRVVVPQMEYANHVLDATLAPEQLVDAVANIIKTP